MYIHKEENLTKKGMPQEKSSLKKTTWCHRKRALLTFETAVSMKLVFPGDKRKEAGNKGAWVAQIKTLY